MALMVSGQRRASPGGAFQARKRGFGGKGGGDPSKKKQASEFFPGGKMINNLNRLAPERAEKGTGG